MPQSLQISAATVDPALLDLPWDIALEQWPAHHLATLPRGISRHVVRFVNLSGRIIAVKEISGIVARGEYDLLWELDRLGAPSVQATAVITGRTDAKGEELNSALVTEHLSYSLPYRALFSQNMRPETATRLIDSLAVLLVRLHLLGFYWGDVSLSNTLFRRDAGAFAAYLVDAETGELHPEGLSNGQRNYDVDLARTNIIGELMDLQAGALLEPNVDTIDVGNRIVERYETLWEELTARESFTVKERWRVQERIRRLNDLGFDVGELSITQDPTTVGQAKLSIEPKVVDAGHYQRQIMRLTGLDVQENQGRRMLNNLQTYITFSGKEKLPIELAAHQWLAEVFEPTVHAVPPELSSKLEPAEIFHEVLEHRWYLSEERKKEVPLPEAVKSYVKKVLINRPDEAAMLDLPKETADGFDGISIEDTTSYSQDDGFKESEEPVV
ncbi:MAG: DUF4032 domain-containing protein [Actinomycetaceae bacterium]|nr:DUF4032 domain-containing protein [Actinomycetaceae bacterium]